MNDHLSSTQISKCIAGDGSPEELTHARSCPACVAEFKRFEDAVQGFRQSLSGYAEQQRGSRAQAFTAPPFEVPRRLAGAFAGVLAAVAIAIAVVAIGPAYWSPVEIQPETSVQADTELLEEVDVQLSRSVPMTLEPLMQMLADGETVRDTNGGRQ